VSFIYIPLHSKELSVYKLSLILCLSVIANASYAAARIGGCTGEYKGIPIEMKGAMSDNSNLNTAHGTVLVDGREVAAFEGSFFEMSILRRSFSVRNNQGDYAEGKVTNVFTRSAVLTRLYIPGYGIDFRNVHIRCWSR
jgi:hypothetical protein